MAVLIGSIVGGFLAIWLLQTLIDFAITSRIMNDPMKGKIFATLSAYVLACLIYSLSTGTLFGIIFYLPGAVIVGLIEMRNAKRIQKRINEADEATTFE
jgi:hypothetical protein